MVIAGLELVEAMGNLALFVDEEAQAMNAVILLAHELLRTPDAKGIGHRVILIGQQAEVEVVALLELFRRLALSGLMPSTTTLRAASSLLTSRRPQAWVVQPGVIALG